jgi:hypothetical protein
MDLSCLSRSKRPWVLHPGLVFPVRRKFDRVPFA